MTIEEKMDHFRSLSLESASSKSAESLSSYKQSLDDDLELHKETASQLAEESKKALMNQVRANSKKKLSSEQMKIKKELTQKQSAIICFMIKVLEFLLLLLILHLLELQSAIKIEVFDRVREKLLEYRKTNDYLVYLENQIKNIMSEYSDVDITIYIDPNDSSLLDELKSKTGGNIEIYNKEFLGGTRTIVPEKNILIDNSFKTRLADQQDLFAITL